MTFSVIIQWQHDIWCHKWWYELLAPWPMCPPSFIEISWKMSEIPPLFNTKTFTTTTTSIIIIIAKMKPHNNKIPFPFWGNGIIIIAKMKPHNNKIPFPFWGNGITRAYWARGPVGDPIPMLLGLRTGNWVKENWAKGRIPIRDASLTCIDNYW